MSATFAYINESGELAIADWDASRQSVPSRVLVELGAPGLIGNDGSQPIALTAPGWSPDGSKLAISVIHKPGPQQPGSALAIVDRDTGSASTIFEGTPGMAALIAPGVPHYVNWCPDGRYLALLAQTPAGMTLFILDSLGLRPVTPVVSGAPLFFCWSPSGDALLVHRANDLILVPTATPESPSILMRGGLACQLPAWHASGDSIFAICQAGGSVALCSLDRNGTVRQLRLLGAAGGAVAWRPGFDQLACAVRPLAAPRQMRGIWIAQSDGTGFEQLNDLQLDAFYWRPDGQELAMLSTGNAGDGLISWSVVEVASGAARRYAPFHGSQDFQLTSAFFEQYNTSHSPWSAEGNALLISGRVPGNGIPPESTSSSIYIQPTDAGAHPFAAGHGMFCSWQPGSKP